MMPTTNKEVMLKTWNVDDHGDGQDSAEMVIQGSLYVCQ